MSFRQHKMNFQQGPIDKVTVVTEDKTLGPTDNLVLVNTASAITITLPAAGEVAGQWFSIAPVSGVTPDVTISEKGTSDDWNGDYALDAATERALFFSDGIHWWEWTDGYYS